MAEECAGVFRWGIADISAVDDFFEADFARYRFCCSVHLPFDGDIAIYLSIADRGISLNISARKY